MPYQQFIANSLKSASKIAKSYFGKVKGTIKSGDNNQVLTKADLEVGKFLISEIAKYYPTDNIIDEETGVIDKKSEFTWVIDPIDGTSNFVQGLPFYGIMIGLLKRDKPIIGAVTLPYFKETIIALKNKGSYSNGKRIHVTNENNLLSCLVAYLIDGHRKNPQATFAESKVLAKIALNVRNIRTSGSLYDYVLLAKGGYGACLNQTSRIWDNVALQIIIEEAGGIYTDFFGKPINYSDPLKKAGENFTVCASSPVLHKQLQEIIHKR